MAEARFAPRQRQVSAPGVERHPKLTDAEQRAIDYACECLGITRAEFVYQATRQALDEFYSEGP